MNQLFLQDSAFPGNCKKNRKIAIDDIPFMFHSIIYGITLAGL